ncbi:MAG: hypothetical protein HYV06_05245 [Deltaproteobacteria bacterium]|nr:hypothetical protein [Deltaproteobacteria bacterium]
MRAFANLFLILFLADGGFSLVDELVSLLTPLAPFTALRGLLGGMVSVTAALVYLCLGIDRRLPKRLFLPLISFVFFCPLSTWLFPALAGFRAYGLLAAAAQVALGSLPLCHFRNKGARCLTMPPALFAAPFFSLRNTLLFGAANLFVVPLALALLSLFAANSYMAGHTSGFMRLGPGGLSMTERVYRRDNRTIRLAAMIHVGSREYYDELAASLATGRTIVLAEGVSDARNLLRDRIDYGRVAGFLGLTSQQEMRLRGRIIEAAELESPRPRPRGAGDEAPAGEADILRADVDVSAFRPPTILLFDALGRHLRESPSFAKGFLAFNSWGEKNITPEMYAIIMDDILHRRNMEVVRHLDKALVRYDTVVIPWGALHMKEIEAEVLKRGFKLREEREKVSIDFRKMLAGML